MGFRHVESGRWFAPAITRMSRPSQSLANLSDDLHTPPQLRTTRLSLCSSCATSQNMARSQGGGRTEEDFLRDGFYADPKFKVVFAEWDGKPAGFALLLL